MTVIYDKDGASVTQERWDALERAGLPEIPDDQRRAILHELAKKQIALSITNGELANVGARRMALIQQVTHLQAKLSELKISSALGKTDG